MSNTLADYTIEKEMGRGGFAITWAARRLTSAPSTARSQPVILKELLLDRIDDWDVVSAFEREARVLSHLKHPGIPSFLDFIEEETTQGKRLFLVQEYIAGRDVERLIQDGRYFTEPEVIAMAIQMTEVLVYLHQFSPPIVHRDIKPSNVMATDSGRYYLVDFGAVKSPQSRQADAGYTMTGTVGYMPLEQIEGKAVPASDIYALGMSLIYILSHRRPQDMEKKNLRVDFRPHVNISDGFARIIDRMTAPDIAQRYASAAQLLEDLKALQTGDKSSAPSSFASWKPFVGAGVALAILGMCAYDEMKAPQEDLPSTPVASLAPEPTPTAQKTSNKSMADYYYRKKNYTQAIMYYDRYLPDHPEDFSGYFRRGFSQGKLKHHEKAVADFLYIVEHDSTPDPMAYHNLGYHYYALERFDASRQYFEATLRLKPNETSALNYLGLIAMHEGHFAEAIDWLNKGIQVDPDYKYFYNNLGQVYLRMKKYPEALAAFDDAILKDQIQNKTVSSQYARPYYHQSEVYLATQEYEKALFAADQALLRSADYSEAFRVKAKAYQALKKCELALEMAQQSCRQGAQDMCDWTCSP